MSITHASQASTSDPGDTTAAASAGASAATKSRLLQALKVVAPDDPQPFRQSALFVNDDVAAASDGIAVLVVIGHEEAIRSEHPIISERLPAIRAWAASSARVGSASLASVRSSLHAVAPLVTVTCMDCNGSGRECCNACDGYGTCTCNCGHEHTCQECEGKGNFGATCQACRGQRTRERPKHATRVSVGRAGRFKRHGDYSTSALSAHALLKALALLFEADQVLELRLGAVPADAPPQWSGMHALFLCAAARFGVLALEVAV